MVPDSVRDPLGYYRNNTVNSRALIECAVKSGVRHFIFSSTAAVYGNPAASSGDGGCADAADLALRLVEADDAKSCCAMPAARTGCSHVILRYFNVAGADPQGRTGQSTKGATHLIKVAVETALGLAPKARRLRHRLSDAGRHLHPRLHPRQRSRRARIPMRCAICAPAAPSLTLNCGYGHGFSVLEVIETVKRVSGVDFKVEIGAAARRRSGADRGRLATACARRSAGSRASTIFRPSSPTRSPGNAN